MQALYPALLGLDPGSGLCRITLLGITFLGFPTVTESLPTTKPLCNVTLRYILISLAKHVPQDLCYHFSLHAR